MTESPALVSIEERQAHEKQALLNALKEVPIVQIACKKAGVSRATYYRWRQEDRLFRRQAMDAMEQGVEFINDMSESQLVTLIKEKKMPAITMWLKHRHPSYGSKAKSYTPLAEPEDLTPEEQRIVVEALAMVSDSSRTKSHEKPRPPIRREHTRQPEN